MTDRDFEKYVDGDSSLSRAYRAGATDKPPASIDVAVREALAAEHAATTSRRSRFHEWHRFLVPMAAAATVLLSFSLVMQLVLDPTGEGMLLHEPIVMSESMPKKSATAAEFDAADDSAAAQANEAVARAAQGEDRAMPAAPAIESPTADSPRVGDTGRDFVAMPRTDTDAAAKRDAGEPKAKAAVDDVTADVYAAEPPTVSQPDATQQSADASDDAFAAAPPVSEPGELQSAAGVEETIDETFVSEPNVADDLLADATEQSTTLADERAEQTVVTDATDVTDDTFAATPPATDPAEQAGAADKALVETETDVSVRDLTAMTDAAADAPAAEAGVGIEAENAKPTAPVFAQTGRSAGADSMQMRARTPTECDLPDATDSMTVELRVAQARCLMEAGSDSEARDAVRALIDDEPVFVIDDYPDLQALMEAE